MKTINQRCYRILVLCLPVLLILLWLAAQSHGQIPAVPRAGGILSTGGGGGSGDVVGPATATDNAIPRYDGTTGELLQDSAVTISDLGAIAATISSGADGLTLPLSLIDSNGAYTTGKLWAGLFRTGGVSYPGLWMGNLTPSISNYSMLSDGSRTYFSGFSGIGFRINNTPKLILENVSSLASLSIGTHTPTAALDLRAGSATANTAPLKFRDGPLLSTPETGAIEFLSGVYYATDGAVVRHQIVLGDATQTLTNKTIDGDANTIIDLGTGAIKANALVTAAEALASSDNDTSVPTTAAVIDGLDAKVSTTAIDTSAELRGVLGDESGTGAAAFLGSTALVKKVSSQWADNGADITTGKSHGFATAGFAGTITGWAISVGSAGTATVKVWKIADGTAVPTIANVINTSGVSLSSGTHIKSSTVTDFTSTAVTAGDVFAFDLTAVSGDPLDVTFELFIQP